jgi:hypothetical protein
MLKRTQIQLLLSTHSLLSNGIYNYAYSLRARIELFITFFFFQKKKTFLHDVVNDL